MKSCKKYTHTTGFEADILGAGNTWDEISKMNSPSMHFYTCLLRAVLCRSGVGGLRRAPWALQPQRREGRNAGSFPKCPGSNSRRLTEKNKEPAKEEGGDTAATDRPWARHCSPWVPCVAPWLSRAVPWVPACGETAALPSPSGAVFVWSFSIP